MQAVRKIRMSPYEHVCGYAEAPDGLICSAAIAKKGRHGVGNDYHEIVIAIRAGFTTGGGTEKIDPLRPIELLKPVDELGEYGIGGGWRSLRHVEHFQFGTT